MNPNTTILSEFVSDFGTQSLQILTETIYKDPLTNLIIYIAAVALFVSVGYELHKGSLSKYTIVFFIAYISLVPINNLPTGFVLVNGLSNLLSNMLNKISYNMLTSFGTKSQFPPGFVLNAITRASGARIRDPNLKRSFHFLSMNCVPPVTNYRGETLSLKDLLSPEIQRSSEGTGSVESYKFAFNADYLKNRTFDTGSGEKFNCYEILTQTLGGIRAELRERMHLAAPSDEREDLRKYKTSSLPEYHKLSNIALNIASSNATSREVYEQFYTEGGSSNWAMDKGLSEDVALGAKGNIVTRLVLNTSALYTSLERALHLDGVVDTALKLEDIDNKRKDLPYYIAFIQVIIKTICPLAIITVFFGSFKPFFVWTATWLISIIIPWLLYLTRIISNSILLWSLKINDSSTINSAVDPTVLTRNMNQLATTSVLSDIERMTEVFVNVELALFSSLMLFIPFAMAMNGRRANTGRNLVTSASGMAVGVASRQAIGTGINNIRNKDSSQKSSFSSSMSRQPNSHKTLASSAIDLSSVVSNKKQPPQPGGEA